VLLYLFSYPGKSKIQKKKGMYGKTKKEIMRTGSLSEKKASLLEELLCHHFFMKENPKHIKILKVTDLFEVL